VRLLPSFVGEFASDTGSETGTTVSEADGRFTLLGVPAGNYTLKILKAPPRSSGGNTATASVSYSDGAVSGGTFVSVSTTTFGSPSPSSPTLTAELSVAVEDRDVADLALWLGQGAKVTGRILFDGDPPPTAEQMPRLGVALIP